MPLAEVTIAEALKESGYSTAFLGKWHLSGTNDEIAYGSALDHVEHPAGVIHRPVPGGAVFLI